MTHTEESYRTWMASPVMIDALTNGPWPEGNPYHAAYHRIYTDKSTDITIAMMRRANERNVLAFTTIGPGNRAELQEFMAFNKCNTPAECANTLYDAHVALIDHFGQDRASPCRGPRT